MKSAIISKKIWDVVHEVARLAHTIVKPTPSQVSNSVYFNLGGHKFRLSDHEPKPNFTGTSFIIKPDSDCDKIAKAIVEHSITKLKVVPHVQRSQLVTEAQTPKPKIKIKSAANQKLIARVEQLQRELSAALKLSADQKMEAKISRRFQLLHDEIKRLKESNKKLRENYNNCLAQLHTGK